MNRIIPWCSNFSSICFIYCQAIRCCGLKIKSVYSNFQKLTPITDYRSLLLSTISDKIIRQTWNENVINLPAIFLSAWRNDVIAKNDGTHIPHQVKLYFRRFPIVAKYNMTFMCYIVSFLFKNIKKHFLFNVFVKRRQNARIKLSLTFS